MVDLDITLLYQAANFLILMFILNLILYKPLMKLLGDRQKRIDDAHDEVRSLEASIDEKVADYEDTLRRARAEAMEERESIKAAGTDAAKDILGSAREEVSEMIQGFKTRAAAEKEEARILLHKQTRRMAREISEKVLGRGVQ
ncbi:MAG: ATP synthase F0 subunit B [Syntrophales bacterium]|jgi:F-type H+-transporting ATPase subunit b|nr:ATP synthase F0 subunit B [Syntrophales bacterium]MCK9528128.1 ATP synthase F0 subunit B [Syntrophales bacterium]MDX9921097.1 ATP synthase F0 subunit B [Syntrophales bacterium]